MCLKSLCGCSAHTGSKMFVEWWMSLSMCVNTNMFVFGLNLLLCCLEFLHLFHKSYYFFLIQFSSGVGINVILALCMRAKLLQSCPILCDSLDYGPQGSSVHGILQARTMKWVAMSPSRGSSQLSNWTHIFCLMSPALAGGFFTTSATWEALF